MPEPTISEARTRAGEPEDTSKRRPKGGYVYEDRTTTAVEEVGGVLGHFQK